MPWLSLATLFSISRRRGIDPRNIIVYVEEEAINPRPRNPQVKRFEPNQDTGDDDRYDYDEENGY